MGEIGYFEDLQKWDLKIFAKRKWHIAFINPIDDISTA